MDPLEDTHEEFEKLKSEEGVAAFIAEKSGLDYERVLRIYRLGLPWPLTDDPAWDFGRQAAETGTDVITCMVSLAPLIDMGIAETQAQITRFEEKVARGEPFSQGEQEEFTELMNRGSVLYRHMESVSDLSGEPHEIVVMVFEGIVAVLNRMNELIGEAIERKRREEN